MAQVLTNALSIASLYALAAMGLTLIFGVVRLIQFAHGEMALMGGYLLYLSWGVGNFNPIVGIIIAVTGTLLLAHLQYRGVMIRLFGSAHLNGIIATLGVALFLQGAFTIGFGAQPLGISNEITRSTVTLGDATISLMRLLGISVGTTVIVVLAVTLKWTEFGRRVRAVAQDAEIAELMGIDAARIRHQVFLLGSGLTALAGILLVTTSFVTPVSGLVVTVISYTIVILGGLGSVGGALIGALLVAFAESLVSAYVPGGTGWGAAIAFGAFVLIAIARPSGIAGTTPAAGG